MKSLSRFGRTTLMGAVFLLMPIVVVAILVDKALEMVGPAVKPLAARMAAGSGLGSTKTLLAVALLILICFLAGLFLNTSAARKAIDKLQTSVLSEMPGFEYVKAQIESGFHVEERKVYPVVLARMDDGLWQMAFLVERLAGGLSAVFVPDVPSPNTGAVYFLSEDRVRLVDLPQAAVLKCLKRFGLGADALLGNRLADSGPSGTSTVTEGATPA